MDVLQQSTSYWAAARLHCFGLFYNTVVLVRLVPSIRSSVLHFMGLPRTLRLSLALLQTSNGQENDV